MGALIVKNVRIRVNTVLIIVCFVTGGPSPTQWRDWIPHGRWIRWHGRWVKW